MVEARGQSSLLKQVDAQGICTLTMNRPTAMNALDGGLVAALGRGFEAIAYDAAVRVVILTGAGDRAFCAGADLKERRTMGDVDVRRRIDEYRRVFQKVAGCPKPVICAINGYAFGGGLELALACDLRLMSEQTKVGLTELRLGIIPGAGGTQRLARLVGPAIAKELIFTAARIDAARALALGIVNGTAPAAELMARAEAMAQQMLPSAPIALAQAKRAIDAGGEVDLQSGLDIEALAYAVTVPTEDRQEGLQAFKEKRAPQFKGK